MYQMVELKDTDDPVSFSRVVFEDGSDVVDFVLVYVRSTEESETETRKAEARQKFVQVLKKERRVQVELRLVRTAAGNREIGFYLLHLTWAVLVEEAERLRLKIPLKRLKAELKTSATPRYRLIGTLGSRLGSRATERNAAMPSLSSCHRQFVMSEILESVVYSNQQILARTLAKLFRFYSRSSRVRLARLLDESVFHAAYPLHQGSIRYDRAQVELSKRPTKADHVDRQFLYDRWASWRCLLQCQPISEIEQYFGTKIAFFFAWLGFYTSWLLPMAVLSMLFFFFGLLDPSFQDADRFICSKESDLVLMCPLCKECSSWHLSDICTTAKFNRLFDNVFTVAFAFVVSIWCRRSLGPRSTGLSKTFMFALSLFPFVAAIFYLEFWKRYSKKLANLWGVLDLDRDEERPSTFYSFHATKQHTNPITHAVEPYFPAWISAVRRSLSFLVLLVFLGVSLGLHFLVILLRVFLYHFMFMSEGLRPFASLVSNVACGLLNLAFIVLVEKLYEKLAKKLARWEMHRTETEYEESLTIKLFVISSFNYFVHAFYIAFLKGRLKLSFGSSLRLAETCSHTGCHIEVAFYLFVTFAGKQMLKNAYDIAYPRFRRFANVIRSGIPQTLNQWENDFQLPELDNLLKHYLQIVIQFGFVVLFVAAFPLGPLFAFVYNLLAIRVYARQLLCESRRVVMVRVNGIGIWFKILESISNFSVLTNGLIIAFSSDFIEKILYFMQNDTSLDGFTNSTLLFSTISTRHRYGLDEYSRTATTPSWMIYNRNVINSERNLQCRYFETKNNLDSIDTNTAHYYRLIALKLAFVLVYQNIASWVQKYIEVSVPDIPRKLKLKLKERRFQSRTKRPDSPGSCDPEV